MTELTVESALERNLEALGPKHADLAERLRGVAPSASLVFGEDAQGVPTAMLDGRRLCSRHRPRDEAGRLVADVDLEEHAVVVVMGFGLGYHVQRLAERLDRTGIVVVFEPDLALLRAVLERVDHSSWLGDALIVWATDAEDRAALARRLHGADSILAQGVHFLEHPASRARLGAEAGRFSTLFGELVTAARTTLLTTLVRSAETVRNLLLNVDHYAAGPGIADLAGAAAGHPAIVVSAGPSLHRQLARLADPAVRERCVIIAVQTTLKPLLAAGVRPHFVTALDYHEISRRFYEQLEGHRLEDVTLVAEPKAHPVILDSWPGPRRCCASGFLDKVLGDAAVDMGTLPGGATVAHLALYLARHIGCDPVILTGQDLGFTDGLYYAPGTAIDDVWAPELNPFNTIEMMQWQRIVRHRAHLHRMSDGAGRAVYTDAQMLTYLQQFERDFAAFRDEGLTIIDATEGGVAKQHVDVMSLDDALRRHATRPLPSLPLPPSGTDAARLEAARQRVAALRREIAALREISDRTRRLVARMLEEQQDAARMERHFARLEAFRAEVSERFDAFELLNQVNQLGVYKRQRADRRLHLRKDLDPLERQRAQLQRDLVNVTWLADAASELIDQLDDAARVLEGAAVMPRRVAAPKDVEVRPSAQRVAALVPVDPARGGLGRERSLGDAGGGPTILQHTLRRLGRCRRLDSIVLLAPPSLDVDALIDRPAIGVDVHVERVRTPAGDPAAEAIAAARAWAPTCWRGGISGMSIYDEVLCPPTMAPVMERRGLTAALLVGPDWPLVDPDTCDAVIERHLEHPEQHRLVFAQAPPGLCGCVVSIDLMRELVPRSRLCTIGALLVYQPHAPQADAIAKGANVQLPHAVRGAMLRAVADDDATARCLAALAGRNAALPDLVPELQRALAPLRTAGPQHVVLEITTRRARRGRLHAPAVAHDMPLETARRLLEQIGARRDAVLTLHGTGDPMEHPDVERIVATAREAGVRHVHLRTELRAPAERLERVVDAGVSVVSVDLHADRAATYELMLGDDGFREALERMEHLLARRRGTPAELALPWIVPRLRRCAATIEDVEPFFDRWQHRLGTAVIEGPPPGTPPGTPPDDPPILEAVMPPAAAWSQLTRRMTVLATGAVPVCETDRRGRTAVGNVSAVPVSTLWPALLAARRAARHAPRAPQLWAP